MLFDGLTVLQHRGQDAAGMVTAEHRRLHLRKDNGLVKDVFKTHHMMDLRGNVGLGHVRYPTAGSSSCAEAQPLYTNYPYGICVAHNGNVTNTEELTTRLRDKKVRSKQRQTRSLFTLMLYSLSLSLFRDILIPSRIQSSSSISLPIISPNRKRVATWSKKSLRPCKTS